MKKIFVLSLLLPLLVSFPSQGKKWTGTVIKEFDNAETWVELITQLKEHKMHYGAVAGSRRVLEYFADMKSKHDAFQSIVELIDFGYPFNLRPVFMAGDLELTEKDNFGQSYNLYKATLDLDKNMPKWANTYFSRVDLENFPKYLFYLALTEFNQKKLDEALVHLDKALVGLQDPAQISLTKKVSRTMARIYYEQTRYKEALDIYQNYLLKMNPLEPADWLEGAWSLYRLGRFEEALGYLYNLEQKELTQDAYLEKYIIRALIYREKCATDYTKSLWQAFEKDYADTISKIKLGESLKSLPQLQTIVDRNSEYRRVMKTVQELQEEAKKTSKLPGHLMKVADYLYASEISNQLKNKDAHEDLALTNAARQLVIMGESLRFLQFDVVREQYNPDKVFAPPPPPPENLVENLPDNRFLLHWVQWGDFWRDEKTLYRGILKNRCE